ncbi:MAG: HPr family phosphocarrier protein [Planctomycetia bacterium]|nr:HPr family phosphocarrier protein [Planctomycetia bacterium]
MEESNLDTQAKVREVVVRNSHGLHARPADLFARQANRCTAKIEVIKEGVRVDGKSILDVLTLAAEQGTVLRIEATGPDAQVALEALAKLIEVDLASEETIDQP